jgi:hypothetical protein
MVIKKINKDDGIFFKELKLGSCFEIDSKLYMKGFDSKECRAVDMETGFLHEIDELAIVNPVIATIEYYA